MVMAGDWVVVVRGDCSAAEVTSMGYEAVVMAAGWVVVAMEEGQGDAVTGARG